MTMRESLLCEYERIIARVYLIMLQQAYPLYILSDRSLANDDTRIKSSLTRLREADEELFDCKREGRKWNDEGSKHVIESSL